MERRSSKSDANDAAAICDPASRSSMRFLPVKTVDQQAVFSVHRFREGFKEERTACIDHIRGLLAKFGLVFPQSPNALREALAEVIDDAVNKMSGLARLCVLRARSMAEIDEHRAWCDPVAAHVKSDRRFDTSARTAVP